MRIGLRHVPPIRQRLEALWFVESGRRIGTDKVDIEFKAGQPAHFGRKLDRANLSNLWKGRVGLIVALGYTVCGNTPPGQI